MQQGLAALALEHLLLRHGLLPWAEHHVVQPRAGRHHWESVLILVHTELALNVAVW